MGITSYILTRGTSSESTPMPTSCRSQSRLKRAIWLPGRVQTQKTTSPSAPPKLTSMTTYRLILEKISINKFMRNLTILRAGTRAILANSFSWKPPALSLRNASRMTKTGTISCDSTNLNERLKCVETGKCTADANSEAPAHSPTEDMNL
jgi:hypothetical protein